MPTTDLPNDRGTKGDGVIDIRRTRACVKAKRCAGCSAVEIVSVVN